MLSNPQPPRSVSDSTVSKRGLYHHLAFKVTLLIVTVIVAVSAATSFIIYNKSYQALKHEIESKLMLIASNAAVSVDTAQLPLIRSQADEGGKVYLGIQKQLQNIKKASLGKVRYIYVVGRSGKRVNDAYYYLVDAVPIGASDHSKVGDEFRIKDYPVARQGFERPVAEQKLVYEKDLKIWSQSGYAPIRDRHGKVLGIIGIDMDVSTLKHEEAELFNARMLSIITCIFLALIFGVTFSGYITRPILILKKGTARVAAGQLDTVVSVSRRDELGELAESFNAMTKDLKNSHDQLYQYNLELEEKVRQRTAQLSAINQEIRDILDNMSQAIFTIGRDLLFNGQHSRFANELFGKTEFAGQNLLDVLFTRDDQQNDRDSMDLWLRKVFATENWENLEPLQPVKEMPIRAVKSDGAAATKHIRINFSPISDLFGLDLKEKVTKLMVIIQDITETKALAIEMEKKEREYKDNLNQIVEVIKMDQELFKDFITESQETLADFEPKLIQLRADRANPELINDLFRIMHSLKGNARFFKLERIAGEAHGIENIFSGIRKGEQAMTDELLDETFRKLDGFNSLFNETLDIYHKIINGANVDKGQIRNEERQKEEHEVIKIKVEELNRLAELIKKADRLILGDVAQAPGNTIGEAQVEAIERLFRETETHLQSLRQIALGRLFTRFHRMTRDISTELGKKARLVVKGEDVLVEKQIFDKIGDPLIHILRNSLDHGIEKPEERKALGKPEEGTIEVIAERQEGSLVLTVRDDGKGLNADRIKAKAAQKGLISAEAALRISDQEAHDLIFQPGFSTNDQVTEISGRGVGMDVVKTAVEELRGTLALQTRLNQGLTIQITIPQQG